MSEEVYYVDQGLDFDAPLYHHDRHAVIVAFTRAGEAEVWRQAQYEDEKSVATIGPWMLPRENVLRFDHERRRQRPEVHFFTGLGQCGDYNVTRWAARELARRLRIDLTVFDRHQDGYFYCPLCERSFNSRSPFAEHFGGGFGSGHCMRAAMRHVESSEHCEHNKQSRAAWLKAQEGGRHA